MINKEEYEKILKQIISCISYGDYYAVKELCMIELKRLQEDKKE